MASIRIGLVGVGKIVRDQHQPVIAANSDFELVATASPHSSLPGIASFRTLGELLSQGPEVDAVAVTSVSAVRDDIAREALAAGKAVFLEKRPCTTLSALDDLVATARSGKLALFASWHSRFAMQVEAARVWLARHPPERLEIEWREDVRCWHSSEDWIWERGGPGVFDPSVNAFSLLTHIAPTRIFLNEAELFVPANRQTPIAATLDMADHAGMPVTATLDWRAEDSQTWEIRARTQDGLLRLFDGGARLEIAGQALPDTEVGGKYFEYTGLYRRFAELVHARVLDVDERPLRLAADAFLIGRRTPVDPFPG
ncbi:Gfo/Idh/MocA family protein [Piscinibacter koreensis]|uniref:Gfo/Idh/MocA family oxidoreductase n=1 Tax=Piscinibacter koreensis TaxID=2742824 RepID=A0A7Y6TYT6_9BURK|nr:Gfo/Idh/MocA family oxidoreductase [Schlegelella koreensis]NUZ08447.1 Gfo/Idh/MocA family oxidoreductase [Schlegelella koreensis]